MLGEPDGISYMFAGNRLGPANGQADRNRARLQPDVALCASAFDVVGRCHLARLRQEGDEAPVLGAREYIRGAGVSVECRRYWPNEAVCDVSAKGRGKGIKAVELGDHNGNRVAVSCQAVLLAVQDLIPGLPGVETADRVD